VSAFNNVVIKRYNNLREPQDRIQVRYLYAPKQRVLHDLINKNQHLTLPAIAVNITSISRDPNRVFNKLDGSYHERKYRDLADPQQSFSESDFMPQPLPVNIGVNMSIIARYQPDIEQIISNFAPYTNPYIVLSWLMPSEIVNVKQEIRSHVQWSGDIAMEYPLEVGEEDRWAITANTSFTIEGWLFREKRSSDNLSNIHTIHVGASAYGDDIVFDDLYKETLTPTLSL